MQNILWESSQKNRAAAQDSPLHAYPPGGKGSRGFCQALDSSPWSCRWPSSIRPHSPLHSVNSFLVFQEAAHLTNGSEAPQDPDTRKCVSAGPSRGDMYYANASVWRRAGNEVRASCGSFQCSWLPRRKRKATGIVEILAVFESNVIWAAKRRGQCGSVCPPRSTFMCLLSTYYEPATFLGTADTAVRSLIASLEGGKGRGRGRETIFSRLYALEAGWGAQSHDFFFFLK